MTTAISPARSDERLRAPGRRSADAGVAAMLVASGPNWSGSWAMPRRAMSA